MQNGFSDILQKLISEQGKELLLNATKCKAFLAGYTRGEYKNESRLLLQAIEAGVSKEINSTVELEICKKQQIRVLREEHFLTAEAAADVVDTLALVLRGEKNKKGTSHGVVCINCGKELQKEWKICPYCGTSAKLLQKTSTVPTLSSVPVKEAAATTQEAPPKKMSPAKRNLIIAFALITATIAVIAFTQYDASESDFEVQREGNGIKITKYTGFKQQVDIPSRIQDLPVTSIGDLAFYNCFSITSVTVPESVTSIGDRAFSDCASLTSITIPGNVASIGYRAFQRCTSLAAINVAAQNTAYTADGVLYNKNKTTLIKYPAGRTAASFIIPNSIASIEGGAFDGCTSLASVTIPSSVANIGSGAFSGCTSLVRVTFQGKLSIPYQSFDGDLGEKYLAGGRGTYTRAIGSTTWRKQP